jgi:ABC-type sulfate transport system permease subunit
MLLALFRIIGLYGLILATVIVVIPFVAYELRKIGDPKELG